MEFSELVGTRKKCLSENLTFRHQLNQCQIERVKNVAIQAKKLFSSQVWWVGSKRVQLFPKKIFSIWQFSKIDVLVNFIIQKFARLKSIHFSQFFWWEVNLRGLRAFILQNVQGSVVETEKKVLLPITQLGKEETLIILLSAWDRSRDSTQKRNLSKHMWRTIVFCPCCKCLAKLNLH